MILHMWSVLRRRVLLYAVLAVAGTAVAETAFAQEAANPAAVRDFNAAAALQNNALYARAAERWQAFIAKYPNDERLDRVHYYSGVCQLHIKQPAEAAKMFEALLTRWPNFSQADGAQYNLGMAYHQLATASGKPEDQLKAATALGKVATNHPQSPYAAKSLYFQGESFYNAGQLDQAVAAYQKLATSYGTSPLLGDALYALGTTQQELKKSDEAIATFSRFLKEAALQNHELTGEVRLRLGISLFDQEKFTEAEPHFEAAAGKQGFAHADFALLRRAQCRLEDEKTAEAAALFIELTKKFPDSTYLKTAQLAAGKCYYLTGKLEEAAQLLQPAAAAGGEEGAEAAYWLGRTLLKQDKPTDALAVLDKAISQSPQGEFAAYLAVARIDALYEIPQRRAETAALYQQFIAQHPDHPLAPQARYMAALAALGAEDFEAARKYADEFLADAKTAGHELAPAVLYIAAEANLLPVEQDMGQGDAAKAEQLYRQLVEKHPDHARAARSHLRIGWCLHRAEKYNDAITYLRGILASLKDAEHTAEAQLLIGRSCAAADKHQEATQAYDAALAAKPDWSRADEVLIGAGISQRELDNADAADQKLRLLIDKYADSEFRDQALYQLGEIAQEKDKQDEALTRFQEVVEKHPQSEFVAPARYGLAAVQFAKKQYDAARTALDGLLAGEADDEIKARGYLLRGLVFQRKSEFDPAVADLEQFLKGNPEAESALNARYALALCRIGQKQFDGAATELASILQTKPDYEMADKIYYELGHAQAEQDKAEDSAKTFRTLAEKYPGSALAPESWFHVGRFHEQQSEATEDATAKSAELTQAADAFAKGLEKAAEAELKEKLRYKLGDMRFRQKNYADAATVLLAQIGEHANGELAGPARYLAAESLFRQEKYQEALPLFEQVVTEKVEQYQAEALFGAGKCAAALEDWLNSQKHFTALTSQFADFAQVHEARYGQAVALHKQNKLAEAQPLYDQITKETETETAAKARFMIGEIAFAQKKYEEAIEHYLEVAVGYPYKEWQALARFETGRCFRELGDKQKAIVALTKMVQQHPDHPRVPDAQKLIEELQK